MKLDEVIAARRAYRALQEVEISPEMISRLAQAASLAPSCFNNQPWRFVFVTDPALLLEMRAAMSRGNEWTNAASMVIGVVSRKDRDCIVKNREYHLFDTGMATALLLLKAAEMGLVAHPIAGFNEEKAREVMAVPADENLITLVIVGRHAEPPWTGLSEQQAKTEKTRPERLPLDEIMRRDRYETDAGQALLDSALP